MSWTPSFDDALERLRGGDYAAALIDHRLGARTGLELVREATAQGCRVPLIILTGDRDPQVDHAAAEAGAVDFLVKGRFEPAELERALRYAIAQGRAIAQVLESRERVAVLESVGRTLGMDGPRRETLQGIVDSIAARLGRTFISIFLADGDGFSLGAQVGYPSAVPFLGPSGHILGLLRAPRPTFLPNQSAGPGSRQMGVGTELCLPLMEGPHVLGLLLVGSPDASPIGETEHSFYVAVADRLAAALSVAAERQDLARRQKRFRDLAAFCSLVAANVDDAGSGAALASAVAQTVGADRAVLARRDGSSWAVLHAFGVAPLPEALEVPAGWSDDAPSAGAPAPRALDVAPTVMTFPLRRGGRVVGLLRLERGSRPFDALERDAAGLVADVLAAALPGLVPGPADAA